MPRQSLVRTAITAALVAGLLAPELPAQRRARTLEDSREEWLEDCQDDRRSRRHVVCEVRESGWHQAGGQSVSADASPNGGVTVRGWDRDSVHVVVKLRAESSSEEAARELAASVRVESARGRIAADGPPQRRVGGWSVSYDIWVPAQTDVDAESQNGPISAFDVEGTIRLATANGPLTVRRLAGDVRARTRNGPLFVELDGARWSGAGLDAETANGPLDLVVPDRYSARLEAGTINGPMMVGFPVTVQGRIGRSRLSTTLGEGGPLIRAVTTNGPATLRRN